MTNGMVPVVDSNWLLGSARDLQRDQLGTYVDAMRRYGDHVQFRIGPARFGFTFDAVFRPEGARQVLASRNYSYTKDAPAYEEFAHLFGNGLVVSEGEIWKLHRRTLQPLFTPHRVAHTVPQIAQVSADLLGQLRATVAGGNTVVDVADLSVRYALQALSRTVFGSNDVHQAVPVLRAALPVMNEYATRRGLSPMRLPRSLPTPANRRTEAARRAMYGLVDEIVRRRAGGHGGEDLLSLLLEARDPETGRGFNEQEIRDEVLIFLVAGFETTATALALTLFLLGRHSDIQQRVRAEACNVLGDRVPEAGDLQDLRYITWVLQETLRLYPALHTLVRKATDDTELLGRRIPRGRIVAVSAWGIHRNPDVWPEPEQFDPERFDPARAGDRDRFAHLPFGAGPRSCIGNHLALAELIVAAATLARTFRISSLDETPAIEAGFTLHPAGPLLCRLEPS